METKQASRKHLTSALGFSHLRARRQPASSLWHRESQSCPGGAPCQGQKLRTDPLEKSKRSERGCERTETDKLQAEGQRPHRRAPINSETLICASCQQRPARSQVRGCSDGAPALSAQSTLDYLHIPVPWTHL